jgi:anti-anti-sigma factor
MSAEPDYGEDTFDVSVVRSDLLTVTVDGPLDFDTAQELLETVGTALSGPLEQRTLAVDLAGLTLCDSMGLSALLSIRRRTDAVGVRLLLVRRPHLLNRLLELTGTYAYLTGESGDGREQEAVCRAARPRRGPGRRSRPGRMAAWNVCWASAGTSCGRTTRRL